MSYVFKSSNPVEASFVETFFNEKGFTCQLIPTGGIYGMQNYDVAVSEDVSAELEAELKSRLSELSEAEEPDSDEESADAEEPSIRPFSLAGILVAYFVAELVYHSTYWLAADFPLDLTRFGRIFVGQFSMLFLVYIYSRKRLGPLTNSFLGFVKPVGKLIPLWLSAVILYEWGYRFAVLHFPSYFVQHLRYPTPWDAAILLAPFSEELFFRGFLLKSLESVSNTTFALILSSLLFGLGHTQYPMAARIIIVGSGLLFGAARINTKSIYVPIGMHLLTNLVVLFFHINRI
jgi:membrane protease YdiL (CAAX protease family)